MSQIRSWLFSTIFPTKKAKSLRLEQGTARMPCSRISRRPLLSFGAVSSPSHVLAHVLGRPCAT